MLFIFRQQLGICAAPDSLHGIDALRTVKGNLVRIFQEGGGLSHEEAEIAAAALLRWIEEGSGRSLRTTIQAGDALIVVDARAGVIDVFPEGDVPVPGTQAVRPRTPGRRIHFTDVVL